MLQAAAGGADYHLQAVGGQYKMHGNTLHRTTSCSQGLTAGIVDTFRKTSLYLHEEDSDNWCTIKVECRECSMLGYTGCCTNVVAVKALASGAYTHALGVRVGGAQGGGCRGGHDAVCLSVAAQIQTQMLNNKWC